MNIYVAPDGLCYPCYALHGEAFVLGNARRSGLKEVMDGEAFRNLKRITVDSTPHCRACGLRYLCGGYCRAWRQGADLDAPPADCSALRRRAASHLQAALDVLGIPPARRHAFLSAVHPTTQPTIRLSDYQTIRLTD